MASADMRDEETCSICLNVYTDPVTIPCGHSFCRTHIGEVMTTQGVEECSCPECSKKSRKKPELKRALGLSNIAESFQSTHQKKRIAIPCTYCDSPVLAAKTCLLCEASLCDKHLKRHSKSPGHVLTEPTTSLENRKCSVHKKVLEYYCYEDAACICVSCSLAGEHRRHQMETLNAASEKKKEKWGKILQKLTSQREEAEKRVQSLEELRRKVQGKAAGVTKRVTALIRDIRKQLKALEKRVLSEISRQKEQVSIRASEQIQPLEIKKEELSRKIGDIEKLCEMTDPVTVFQGWELDRVDYCDTEEDTKRCDIKVLDVGDLNMHLISVTLHSGLAGIVAEVIRRRRVPEASDMLLDVNTTSDMLLDVNTTSDMLLVVHTTSDMLLDVNTAGNNVSVSEDLKTASWMKINQRRPKTPERFHCAQVLSSRSFSSGRHYWEVEVSELGGWVVGMAYPSIKRRGWQSGIGYNNKSWGLERKRKCFTSDYSVIHDSKATVPCHPSCHRLAINLDYEAGRLSFYELCDPIRHLHTFNAVFTEPLHAGFSICGGSQDG